MPLTPDRWERLDRIYHAALALAPADRGRFLDETCAGDPDLHREVTDLLAWDSRAESFLAKPLVILNRDPFEEDAPAAAPPLEPGTTLGTFRIVRLLGRGGMGDVYEADDVALGRRVALKLLTPALTGHPAHREPLLREARAASALNHPAIVTIHAVNQDVDGRDFIVMEYVEGVTLNARLEQGPLDLATALDMMRQIVEALEAAHAHGLVHRDIKPANILVRPDNKVKLLDFGLAHPYGAAAAVDESRSELTLIGLLGTPSYMSPEQARGRPIDVRSDVFSFGVVFYETITGRRPFRGNSHAAVLHAIVNEEAPPSSTIATAMPAAVGRIIVRCLRKDPAERFQSIAEVKTALEAVMDARLTSQRRLWWFAAVSLVMTLSVAAGALVWQSGRLPWSPKDRATLPSNPEVARLYLEAVARLRRADGSGARPLLERVIAAEPKYALGHSALGAAWRMLGNEANAKEEARRALELSGALSREERLLVEARYWATMGDKDKPLDLYRTLFRYFPDNVEYGYSLAGALAALNRRKEAMATLDALRRTQPSGLHDPRIDLMESNLARGLGDLNRAQDAAARAVGKAAKQGAHNLVASARIAQGHVSEARGELEHASARFKEAAEAFAAIGDQRNVAAIRLTIGNLLWRRGDFGGARNAYELSAETHRQAGAPSAERVALNNLLVMLSAHGDLADAKKIYDRVLSTLDADNRRPMPVAVPLGTIVFRQGEPASARSLFDRDLAVARQFGSKEAEALALEGLTEVLAQQGELPAALRAADAAVAVFKEIQFGSDCSTVLTASAAILLAQGDLGGARRALEEAAAIPLRATTSGDRQAAAERALTRAGLALQDGRFVEAGLLAKEAADLFHVDGFPDNEASAYEILARALLSRGKSAEAERAIDRARALSKTSQNRVRRLSLRINTARMNADSIDPALRAAALRDLEAVRHEAAAIGFVALELEARLALAETQIKSGRLAEGRTQLAALERDAAKRGFGLIAKKAGDLLAAPSAAR